MEGGYKVERRDCLPLWFELLVDLPLCVVAQDAGVNEAPEIELFRAEVGHGES